jgi:hypothetical protein
MSIREQLAEWERRGILEPGHGVKLPDEEPERSMPIFSCVCLFGVLL